MTAPVCDLVLTGARVIDPETGLDGIRSVGVTAGTITAVASDPPPGRASWDVSGGPGQSGRAVENSWGRGGGGR